MAVIQSVYVFIFVMVHIPLTTLTCSGSEPGLSSLLLLQLPDPPDRRRTEDDDWPMSGEQTHQGKRLGTNDQFHKTYISRQSWLRRNRNIQCYLMEAGAAPRQWECWGVVVGSGTAGETPWVGALAVTHPGGETRPRRYWVVRTSPIFHTEIYWCMHSHTKWSHFAALCIKKIILPVLSLFSKIFYILRVYSGVLVDVHVLQQTRQTLLHANRVASQVKMNWLWVRAMRGRAYGSDEAENWSQRKTESKKERKNQREGEKKGEREGGELKNSIQKYRPL